MPEIDLPTLNRTLDDYCKVYDQLLGTSSIPYGVGAPGNNWGANYTLYQLYDVIRQDAADRRFVEAMLPVLSRTFQVRADARAIALALAFPAISAINGVVARYDIPGVLTLDDYLVLKNTGEPTKWQALQHPNWLKIHEQVRIPSRVNMWFRIVESSRYPDGLGRRTASSFTAGDAVPNQYAGGFPRLKVNSVTGTGVVTVVGSAMNPATKDVVSGVTWSANVTGTGLFTLQPGTAPADSLILSVTDMTLGIGIAAIDCVAEAHPPASRYVSL